MPDSTLIFIHGLGGSSQGVKATLLRGLFPDILTPDFPGLLEQRMEKLRAILGQTRGWTLIGSSFGGLMATLFACQNPEQVERLVLLAPALTWPDFAADPPAPISVPTTIYHGRQDHLISLEILRSLAEQIFLDLTFHAVDDDHGLHKTAHAIDWPHLLGRSSTP
jgi:pimeloyl-ACP methyl ester carboxylesterase